jgi:nicotinate-nucleotide pyrophosphorylase (carboxylating)
VAAMTEGLAWEAVIDLALGEDMPGGDVTSRAVVAPDKQATGYLLAKADGIISGLDVARTVLQRIDPAIQFARLVQDGDAVTAMTPIAQVSGSARSILAGERIALNLLQHLSGVATVTARYVAACEGTRARVVDTRKTTPGLRALEKAAVRDGGGQNHRFGLTDGVLIKDNHLAAVGGPDRVTRAITLARENAPHTLRIEVEVTNLDEFREALTAGADIIMLDNMEPETMRQAVVENDGRTYSRLRAA